MSRHTSLVILTIVLVTLVLCDAAPAIYSQETADELSIVLGKANLLLDRLLANTESDANKDSVARQVRARFDEGLPEFHHQGRSLDEEEVEKSAEDDDMSLKEAIDWLKQLREQRKQGARD